MVLVLNLLSPLDVSNHYGFVLLAVMVVVASPLQNLIDSLLNARSPLAIKRMVTSETKRADLGGSVGTGCYHLRTLISPLPLASDETFCGNRESGTSDNG